jgi:hypothetical protein
LISYQVFEKPEILWEETEKEIEASPDDFGGPDVLHDGTAPVFAEQHWRRRTRFEKLQIPVKANQSKS